MQQTSNMNLIVVAHSFMLLQLTVVALPRCKARVLHALHYTNMRISFLIGFHVHYLIRNVQKNISATTSVLFYSH